MENWIDLYAGRTCFCDHYAPPLLVLRSKHYVQSVAAFLVSLDMSGDEIADWIHHMITEVHQGRLYDHEGKLCDLRGNTKVFERFLPHEDLKSCINRIKRYATKPRTRRLRKDAIKVITVIGWAAAIHQCVTDGPCSER